MSLHTDGLYELLPAYQRRRDAELGYPLQALFEIFATEGGQVVDDDLDHFADAMFVETCAEILLPRIGALVGAETIRPLPPGAGVSLRAFIGNVLRYRRAKGTAAALEMLSRDVTGYSAKAVEYFRKLSVTQTVRAPTPERPATAMLRDPDGRARQGGAFDGNPRTPDMRSIARAHGRYGISNVGLHLWRLEAIPYVGPDKPTSTRQEMAAVPSMLAWNGFAGHFSVLPGGRAVSLFRAAHNDERGSPAESDVPARLRRLPLFRELEHWRAAIALDAGDGFPRRWFAPGREAFTVYLRHEGQTDFVRVPAEQVMIGALDPDAAAPTPPWTRPPGVRSYFRSPGKQVDLPVAVVVDPTTGRLVVAAAASGAADVAEVKLAHAVGHPGPLGGGAYDRNDFASPFEIPVGALVYVVGAGPAPGGAASFTDLAAALAQWTSDGADRIGYIVVNENLVETGAETTLEFTMPARSDLTVVAAEWREPTADSAGPLGFIVRRSRRLMLLRPLVIKSAGAPVGEAGALTIDGVYADQGVQVEVGALGRLQVRHSTIRPVSGIALALRGPSGGALTARISRSICGPLTADAAVSTVALADSIVHGAAGSGSIQATDSGVDLTGVTVFGALSAKTLTATNAVLMDDAEVKRRQQGCVRYSYLGGTTTQLPRRYRCQPDLALEKRAELLGRSPTTPERDLVEAGVRPTFVDADPGEPGFAQLAMDASAAIAFGGEGESEMGAWGFLGGATRLANLDDLFADYLPFGLEARALRADRSSIEARGSDVP